MTKLLAYAVAGLLAVCLALGFGLWRSVSANGTLREQRDTAVEAQKQAQAAQKRTEGILTQVRKEKRATGLQSEKASEAVKRAVEAAPEWGSTPTPPQVDQALQEALRGLQ